jgi:glycogen operon protein
VNIAVFSAHATQIELCVFDADGGQELSRTPMPGRTHDIFHAHLPGAGAGLVYGFRAHGSWRPDRGYRFNPNKLLLDPYAREVAGRFEWRHEQLGADPLHPGHMDLRDNAAFALKARVVDDRPGHFDWGDDTPPLTPAADSVIYELHVKGFTRLHPGVPEALRGSYAGLASDAAVAHLKRLGVTAVSLLPVHLKLPEQRLHQIGLSNYWGYNTIGFFCAEPSLASGSMGLSPRDEFRAMVKVLHAAGIEVILDVVYNHSAEGNELGPTVCFRGLDNSSYYRLPPGARGHYENASGCGNTLDIRQPRVLQLVMDSLRYWVGEMHVDGFRFDLAPVLGRGDHGFDPHGPFFAAVAQDPLLARVKLIAEPWDLGHHGYQLGHFPRRWHEWNDRFRDTMRAFWVQGRETRGHVAQRLCGSSDLFQPRGREPAASVNYVVSHDGFTLADLVSYNERHNEANGESNGDGHGHNHNWNCGVEGPSTEPAVVALRDRIRRALLASTILSQGIPMLAAGDELGHTQSGNNNPYCQDNEISWIDWTHAEDALIEFTSRLIALRRAWLPLGERWYDGLQDRRGLHDLAWLRRDGTALEGGDWHNGHDRAFGCVIGRPGRATHPLVMLFNGADEAVPFVLPAGPWQVGCDTAEPERAGTAPNPYPLAPRSVALLASTAEIPA